MTDRQFEEFLREAAPEHHRPPETPKERIWARIEAERRTARGVRDVERRVPQWVTWGMGIAAALVLGVGIGMQLRPAAPGTDPVAVVAAAPDDADANGEDGVVRLVALEHLSRTEGFLTMFRADARAGQTDADVAALAHGMLVTTRLLQSSAAAQDQQLRGLLDDLELILVQIAQLRAGHDPEEAGFITQGIEQRDILLKLRAAAGERAALAGIQGVL